MKYAITKLILMHGHQIEDPHGRHRTRVSVLMPLDGTLEDVIDRVEGGIVVGGKDFLPYGSFFAEVAEVKPPKPAAKAPEPVQTPAAPKKAPAPLRKRKRRPAGL